MFCENNQFKLFNCLGWIGATFDDFSSHRQVETKFGCYIKLIGGIAKSIPPIV
jgi:hypothetical protein